MGSKWRYGSDGILELVDEVTGQVIERQKTKEKVLPEKYRGKKRGRPNRTDDSTHHWVKDGDGKNHWVRKGTSADDLPRTIYPYSIVMSEQICSMVMEGNTLVEIGKTPGMPTLRIIHTWMRKFPEFKAELKLAKEARAEFYADQAIETAKTADSETVAADKLRVETFKWAAEVGNRNEYGKHTKISGDADAPLSFIIDTGVRRAEDANQPEEIEVKSETVEE